MDCNANGDAHLYYVHFVVPMGIYPMGNSCRFPQGKPAATESRYPTLINDVHAVWWCVCVQVVCVQVVCVQVVCVQVVCDVCRWCVQVACRCTGGVCIGVCRRCV